MEGVAGIDARTIGIVRGGRRRSRRSDSTTVGQWTRWIAAALSLALASCATADGPTGEGAATLRLTLDEAVRLALRNNRTILSVRHDRQTEKFALEVAEDRYRPRATIGSSVRDERSSGSSADLSIGPSIRIPTGGELRLTWSQPLTDSDARPGGWALGFEQPLLKGFGAEVDTAAQRIARISEEQNILALRDTIARTIVSVIREYRSVIRAHRALAISREALSRAERQLETNRSLVGVGRMAANEVIPTEAEVANRQLTLADSENGVVSANAALISILDIDTATRVHPAEELPSVEEVRPDLERNIETAFANRSDYLRALMDREVAETNLRVAKDARRWDLRLQATTSRNRGGEHNYAVGLGLAIPLGDQAPKLRVLRAKGSLRKAAIAIVELRQSTRIAIRQASHNAEVGFRRVALARRVRELAQRKVDVEQEKLARGLTSTIQLSAVEDDFVRAQTGELDSIISYLNALTSLDQAMGTTLRTWGVDIDSIDSEPVRTGHDRVARGEKAPEDSLRLSTVLTPQGRTAVAQSAHGSPVTAVSQRASLATRGTGAVARTGTGETSAATELVRAAPELLLSIREFVPAPAIAPVYPETTTNAGIRSPVRVEAAVRN